MYKIFISAIALVGLVGCNPNVKTHQMFYGTTPPPVVSITVGVVDIVKPIGKIGFSSPSMISPNQLAIVKMLDVLTGEGIGEKIGLAYESRRSNEPIAKHQYVFLWDKNGKCVEYFSVKGNFYLKDGHEVPLEELKKP